MDSYADKREGRAWPVCRESKNLLCPAVSGEVTRNVRSAMDCDGRKSSAASEQKGESNFCSELLSAMMGLVGGVTTPQLECKPHNQTFREGCKPFSFQPKARHWTYPLAEQGGCEKSYSSAQSGAVGKAKVPGQLSIRESGCVLSDSVQQSFLEGQSCSYLKTAGMGVNVSQIPKGALRRLY